MNNYDYIIDAFTKDGSNVNEEVDNLTVGCISSQDNNFSLDSQGNLTVNSITFNDTGNISKQVIVDLIFPVGSIYMSVNGTNPGTLFGGTWVAWGSGKVPVGVNTSEVEFNYPEKEGGEKTHTLTINEMPSHNHRLMLAADSGWTTVPKSGSVGTTNGTEASYNTGGSQAHNNLQPYITCYMWKRIA